MKDLSGKKVLITGGARGVGLEIALEFARRGAHIVIADRDERELPEARAAVEVLNVPVRAWPVDVTDPPSIVALRERVLAEVGPLDVLVNNAGVVFGGPFADVPLAQHLKTYEVNTLGVVAMTHAFLPDLVSRPEAHLVNMASASGFIGLPYGATYASSKWAVIGFSESIRSELALIGQDHVRVTIVCPSYIGTGMFEGVTPPKTTHVLEPDFVAARVVEAVEHDTLYVLEPWLVKLTPLLRDLLPTRLYDMLGSALGATTGMTGWIGHGPPKDGPGAEPPSD
jgi:all-trans-retinol dehydrogenase (NAD+)